ncbi:MAG: dipeptidase [Alphaproteobacteria bacterium]|nr:dipeptidase [Alphaproteobacteria bacterium]
MSLHDSSILFDGLVVSRWSPQVFADMKKGGLTAANCTCCVWENMRDTLLNIAAWYKRYAEHPDLLMPVHSVADIRRAKELGRVGIVLGFQNTSAIEDRLDLLPLFRRLGVGFIQLTYNTQNLVGAGCWEENDSGLSGFGREVVGEMNRLGMVVDLSHVGARTAEDAISVSQKPCTYSHVCPRGLFDHPRNKTDDQLRRVVDRGGFVGVATYPPFMKQGKDATLDDCVSMFEYMIDVCGEGNVGIGTDFTQGYGEEFFDWLRHDKGYARRMVPQRGSAPMVKGLETLADYPNLTRAFEKRGWSEARITGVLGENWLGYLARVWGG